jgi:peptidoglycan/xylan/chitin deacetylase (PgdA/CDA1 family)
MTTAVRERTVMNITFHGVGPQPRVMDAGEDRVWVGSARFAEILDTLSHHDDVSIMFDDGNASDVREALPALLDRGLHATFFVVADRLGAPHFLHEDDVRLLAERGMSIGTHGMRHRPWRGLGDDDLNQELGEARRRLEEVVGRPVTHAACPFGAYDRRVLGALRSHGYERVFTSDGGAARSDRWLQARTSLSKDTTAADVERMLGAQTPALAALRVQAKSLVKRWR